ncbi:MAG TPA: histidinol dehydrogenase [Candidatus Magasanikbacteria bacterium]|nr:histidinol dehydrogenase [Candidatus Magasanikbacteria bacterium]
MQIVKLAQFKTTKRYKIIMKRSCQNYDALFPMVKKIMNDIEKNGDTAIKKYTKKFDGINIDNPKVSTNEIKTAYKKVSKQFLTALNQAISNITAVHQTQLPSSAEKIVKPTPGIKIWKKWQSIERVGLYVPGGKALYPSSVLMNGIPAKIAGCKNISIITPPRKDGTIAPEILVTANMIGIKNIYKIGGIQAIGALTYGTETIPKVDKIVGPGNAYVTVAKMIGLMSGKIAIDSPAGPSENLIIADNIANPKFVTADLMCDIEHGGDSAAILATTSNKLAEEVRRLIKKEINKFSTKNYIKQSIKKYSQIIIANSIKDCITFANDYAPEHIQIMTTNSKAIAKQITNAGSIFIGSYTCKSAGDYATGANHVLPTGGSAKMFSGLSVLDFVRLVEYQTCTKQGLKNIKKTIETFAEVENLPAHKYSCSIRFNQ